VPWPQALLAPSRVWPLTDGAGVTVAVVDSGVQANAAQLGAAVAAGSDLGRPGSPPAAPSSAPGTTDCIGHGTFIAGMIAARAQSGSAFTGIAPGVTILPEEVTGPDGKSDADHLAAGIRAAADSGARVIDVAAVTSSPDTALSQAVDHARALGALIIAAAVDDNDLNSSAVYPAAYPGVLAVGGIDDTGAAVAQPGATVPVALVAPASDVVSVGAHGGYYAATGTAFATPFVAGAAALVWAYHPQLTADQVAARLEETADPPSATSSASPAAYGHGVVDPYAAVTAVLPVSGTAATLKPATPRLAPDARPAPPPGTPKVIALAVAGATAGLGGLGAVLRILIPRGRSRRWRAG
jgi:type VII secretion-associated serine protease mycosin